MVGKDGGPMSPEEVAELNPQDILKWLGEEETTVPEMVYTLGRYLTYVRNIYGEESPAYSFIQRKIASSGENDVVTVPAQEMMILLQRIHDKEVSP